MHITNFIRLTDMLVCCMNAPLSLGERVLNEVLHQTMTVLVLISSHTFVN